MIAGEAGAHVFPRSEGWAIAQVMVWPVRPDEEPRAVVAAQAHMRARWLEGLAAGGPAVTPESDPWAVGPVVRVYDAARTLDLVSGMLHGGPQFTPVALRNIVLSRLPLPAEVIG